MAVGAAGGGNRWQGAEVDHGDPDRRAGLADSEGRPQRLEGHGDDVEVVTLEEAGRPEQDQ